MSSSGAVAAGHRDTAPEHAPRRIVGRQPSVGAAAAAKAVAEDTSALIRAELALAKAELTGAAKVKGMGAGLLVGAGVVGWLALQGVLITVGLVLALVLPAWAAALIVTAILLVIAAALGLVGRSRLQTPVKLDTTKHNVEEDVTWAKAHLPRR